MKKKKGFTLIELLVVIAIIAMLLAILMPALGKVKKLAMRLVCGTNLKGMANAMNVYAFDYNDEYPVAGGAGAADWTGTTENWFDPGATDKATVSVAASLYMLVREADVGVKSFVCKASDQQAFINSFAEHGQQLAADNDIVELWDFGDNPSEHQSYSYQVPYDIIAANSQHYNFPADGTSDPANAIMADRNPWFDETMTYAATPLADDYLGTVSKIDYTATQKYLYECGNAAPHDREGQNVLFNDGHVDFAKHPDVGARYDNIYTTREGQAGGDDYTRRNGVAPNGIGTSLAKSRQDSVLVGDSWHK